MDTTWEDSVVWVVLSAFLYLGLCMEKSFSSAFCKLSSDRWFLFSCWFLFPEEKVGIGVQNSAYAKDACIGLGDLRITGHWLLLLNQGKESL